MPGMHPPPTPEDPDALDGEGSLGLRERKRLATEAAMRAAALDLASERGFDDVTVDEICARAGVSPRTFFNYFASKEDAVLHVGPTPPGGPDLARFVAGGPGGALLPDLATMMGQHMSRHLPPAADLTRHHRLLSAEPRLQARFRAGMRAVEEGIAAAIAERTGRDAGDHEVQVLVAVVSGLVRVSMMRWVADGGESPLADQLDHTFGLLDRALDTDVLLPPRT